MFFGSGNLVFPIAIGVETYGYSIFANLGLLITGILVPWIGLMSATYSNRTQKEYFALLGDYTGWWVCFLMLCLIGPFGVCPRCTLVAFGGVKVLNPNLDIWMFSLVFCTLSAFIVLFDRKLITVIGKYLTPFLLGGILLIIAGNFFSDPAVSQQGVSEFEAFRAGMTYGYHTMDLVGALFFGFTTASFFTNKQGKVDANAMKYNMISSTAGMLILAGVYAGLVYLGGKYNAHLCDASPEKYIVVLSEAVLGPVARYVSASVSFLACLTTIVVLIKLFAEFFEKEICRGKITYTQSVVITATLTFIVSLTGFAELSKWLGMFLQTIYPALVVFAIAVLLVPHQRMFIQATFWLTVVIVNAIGYWG